MLYIRIWRQIIINGHETKYAVSSLGEVYNWKTGKPLKLMNKNGYMRVTIVDHSFTTSGHKRWFFVHRLVAMMFIPNPENKPQVNHIDHDRANNCVANLEWCTAAENNEDKAEFGMASRILDENQVREICKRLQNGERPKYIAPDYGVKEVAIKKIAKGITWRRISKDYDIHLKNNKFKITEKQAIEICKRLENGEKARKIAEIVGTTEGNIRNIINGRNWKWISKNYTFPDSKRDTPLTEDKVHRICFLLELGELSHQEIADMIGCKKPVVDRIKERKNWVKISANYDF